MSTMSAKNGLKTTEKAKRVLKAHTAAVSCEWSTEDEREYRALLDAELNDYFARLADGDIDGEEPQ